VIILFLCATGTDAEGFGMGFSIFMVMLATGGVIAGPIVGLVGGLVGRVLLTLAYWQVSRAYGQTVESCEGTRGT